MLLMVATHAYLKVQCIHFQEAPQWRFVCLQVCSQEMLIHSKEGMGMHGLLHVTGVQTHH